MKKEKSFSMLLYVFIICSVIGYLWEGSYRIFRLFLEGKPIEWRHYKGLIYGPFSQVYGIAGLLLVILIVGKNYSKIKIFLISFFGGGILEYLMSFLQEKLFNAISWNYTGRFLNIGGRTTLIYMFLWGALGYFFVLYLYPLLKSVITKVPERLNLFLTIIFTMFFAFNIIISSVATIRYEKRYQNIAPKTKLDFYLDKHYGDEFMKKKFRNIIWVDKND